MAVFVSTDTIGNVRCITLNRPECLNAVNRDLVLALRQALIEANGDDSVFVILLRGAGDAFCSGTDLKDSARDAEMGKDSVHVQRVIGELQDVTRQIVNGNKIVIAAVHGWAVGAGFEWVVNCDFSIWAKSARAFFPEARWGLSATGGVLALLPRIVGQAKAREMLLLGDKYDADGLLRLGIAHQVVADESLDDAAFQLAERISALPPETVSRFKRAFAKASCATLEESLAIETEMLAAAVAESGTLDKMREFRE